MASVDSGYALWLRSPALYANAAAVLPAGLQASAIDSEIISPLATKAAAEAEAARQIAVLGGVLVEDRHVVAGARRDLIGKCITLQGDQLGYDAGVAVFVIDADEQEDNLTALHVLRRLS